MPQLLSQQKCEQTLLFIAMHTTEDTTRLRSKVNEDCSFLKLASSLSSPPISFTAERVFVLNSGFSDIILRISEKVFVLNSGFSDIILRILGEFWNAFTMRRHNAIYNVAAMSLSI